MHPTLLAQLLGKVGEAWLTHAKANNLPEFAVAGCAELVCVGASLRNEGRTAHCNPEDELQPQPVWETGVSLPACAELALVELASLGGAAILSHLLSPMHIWTCQREAYLLGASFLISGSHAGGT